MEALPLTTSEEIKEEDMLRSGETKTEEPENKEELQKSVQVASTDSMQVQSSEVKSGMDSSAPGTDIKQVESQTAPVQVKQEPQEKKQDVSKVPILSDVPVQSKVPEQPAVEVHVSEAPKHYSEPVVQTKHDLPRKEAEVKSSEKSEGSGVLVAALGVVGVATLGLIWLWARTRK